MSMFSQSLFKTSVSIPEDTKFVFVSDMFVKDYIGGAELTTQSIIDSCPEKYHLLHSKEVTMELLSKGQNMFWIFGNFSQLKFDLIPSIIANMSYSIVEYDFKFCSHRSPEKHLIETGLECDCHEQPHGKLVSAFYYAAKSLWWMSDKQQQTYISKFPFLKDVNSAVLSSVFSENTLTQISDLRKENFNNKNNKWLILGSPSWIKGFESAKTYCEKHDLEYVSLWDVSYEAMLTQLSLSKGLVYTPQGGDTCPRLCIEAALLGCELVLNDNVLHKDEDWFKDHDENTIREHLLQAPGIFWKEHDKLINYVPEISGYTTVMNCESQDYPYMKCIESMLNFCSEVCVADGGSNDGTWERLVTLAGKEPRLKIKQIQRDWSHSRHAIFDGMQKAEARKLCTKEFCWQMDSDEIVHEKDYQNIVMLAKKFPKDINMLALPVVEYWGSDDKVRVDITPWKWRFSRNLQNITHGIPKEQRLFDENNTLYAAEGTDGCDMIDSESCERIDFANFYSKQADDLRKIALLNNDQALEQYKNWFNQVINSLPAVYHYSWFDLNRKIKLYRNYWQNHWLGLYNKDTSDSNENNMFFDCPWSDVTDDMIDDLAGRLKNETGGHIWHTKWKGTKTPHITVDVPQPKIMK